MQEVEQEEEEQDGTSEDEEDESTEAGGTHEVISFCGSAWLEAERVVEEDEGECLERDRREHDEERAKGMAEDAHVAEHGITTDDDGGEEGE